MAIDRSTLQQHRILANVEDGLTVCRPFHRLQRSFHVIRQHGTRAQILEANGVYAAAGDVLRPRQHVAIGACSHLGHPKVILAFGHRWYIKQHFCLHGFILRRWRPASAHVGWIFRARVEARPIPVAVIECRHGGIIFLDASTNLFDERLLQRHQPRHHGLGVRLFRVEIRHDVSGLLLRVVITKPVVLVGSVTKGTLDDEHFLARHRRLEC